MSDLPTGPPKSSSGENSKIGTPGDPLSCRESRTPRATDPLNVTLPLLRFTLKKGPTLKLPLWSVALTYVLPDDTSTVCLFTSVIPPFCGNAV